MCQYITAQTESGQQRVFDECQAISLPVLNITTDTFSWGHFIFLGHYALIRSHSTSNVAYRIPGQRLFSCQLFLQGQRGSNHRASQNLGPDRVEDCPSWESVGFVERIIKTVRHKISHSIFFTGVWVCI